MVRTRHRDDAPARAAGLLLIMTLAAAAALAAGCATGDPQVHGTVAVGNYGGGVSVGVTVPLGQKDDVAESPRRISMSQWKTDLKPLVTVADLDLGETRTVTLSDGSEATVKVVGLEETRDTLREAVRRAEVTLEVNGQRATLVAGTYNLPRPVGGVQVDVPVTRGYLARRGGNVWRLASAVRVRLWPTGSPWIAPGTFCCPARQAWFASATQMANEPTWVDGVEPPDPKGKIYYHDGLDFGGCEGLVECVAAADGLIVAAGSAALPEYERALTPGPRNDRVHLLDRRGWIWVYSHLATIADGIEPGVVVRMGQTVGTLGKEGTSGGWSHLHFGLSAPGPDGKRASHDAYAFAWQANLAERKPKVIAVARPHHYASAGETVTLDGSKSWSASAGELEFAWFAEAGDIPDKPCARGATMAFVPPAAGVYNRILRVRDAAGRVAYDFAVVEVIGRGEGGARLKPPGIHAAFAPSEGVRAGEPVTFKVRSFESGAPGEVLEFGDGTPPVTVHSDGNADHWAKDGYAATRHAFAAPGDYIVTARCRKDDMEAVTRVWVRVE